MKNILKKSIPKYAVYQVEDHGDDKEKGFWNPVGAAWMHNDSRGMNIQLKSIPLNGKLVLREIEKPEAQ